MKIGQLRRTVGIIPQSEWATMNGDERDAANALTLHVWWRARQERHQALEDDDCIFLTVRHVQRLLRAVGAPKRG